MNVNNEKRMHPRIDLQGVATILLAGITENGAMKNLSRTGIQLECHYRLIEQLSAFKSNAGVYPDFELEFNLPSSDEPRKKIKPTCNVSYCRRQSQDSYLLGLNFIVIAEQDEAELVECVKKAFET